MTKTKTTSAGQPRYRWDSPAAWVEDKLLEGNRAECTSIARELLGHVDGDVIQDSFQSEMQADGFFRDLNRCPDCETRLTSETTIGGHPSYCQECDREVGDEE